MSMQIIGDIIPKAKYGRKGWKQFIDLILELVTDIKQSPSRMEHPIDAVL